MSSRSTNGTGLKVPVEPPKSFNGEEYLAKRKREVIEPPKGSIDSRMFDAMSADFGLSLSMDVPPPLQEPSDEFL